jgi:adenosylmethionine-8-amino-7-oxononanoate aminotransferase
VQNLPIAICTLNLETSIMYALPADWGDRVAFDRAHVWHPFTQEKDHVEDPPIPVIGAEGVDYVLDGGRRVFDGISSWWCNIHGHGHPRLVAAMQRQAARMGHVMFAGFTHRPALELVARLGQRLPQSLVRCFFSDDGSTAVEVALKMAFQAQIQRGEKGRARFGALRGGYHGDTLGAVGVGELDNWLTGLFRPLLMSCDRLSVPEDPRPEIGNGNMAPQLGSTIEEIGKYFCVHGPQMAAFIAEPLVQGAGGMRFWPPELLREIRVQCTKHGVYLILDEVMTGFGRTGHFLALDACGAAPDLLCLAKGLTGGLLPLALTWASEEIYQLFWGDHLDGRAFFHGHTHTANSIACAVACEGLAIFEEENVMERAEKLSKAMHEAWTKLAAHPAIRRARILGCIAAAQMVDPKTGSPHAPSLRYGWKLHRRALGKGLLIRPMGDCLYLMPPLAAPPERVFEAAEIIEELLDG